MLPKGYIHSEKTREKIRNALKGKSIGSWNIGKKASKETRRKMSIARKGMEFTEEHKRKIAESRIGEKHPLWKGDKVGYKSLHQWVIRRLGRAEKCSSCNSIKNTEWANVSHTYTRQLEDWIKLCKKCHRKFDKLTRGTTKGQFQLNLGGFGNKIC